MDKLLIYTGPIQSGKSTKLLAFVKGRKDVCGILSPMIDGRKYLYDISSGERKLLEADSEDEEIGVITIGRYKFKEKVFEWGRGILQKSSQENNAYLIIDEIGLLEFEGKGLSPVVDEIILKYFNYYPKILLVVRESLLGMLLEYFKLKPEDIEFFKFD